MQVAEENVLQYLYTNPKNYFQIWKKKIRNGIEERQKMIVSFEEWAYPLGRGLMDSHMTVRKILSLSLLSLFFF